MSLQEITWLITILSFVGGIAIFLFRKILVEPLQHSINSLNETLKEFKLSTNKQLDLHDREIEQLKLSDARQEQQIKSLFERERV